MLVLVSIVSIVIQRATVMRKVLFLQEFHQELLHTTCSCLRLSVTHLTHKQPPSPDIHVVDGQTKHTHGLHRPKLPPPPPPPPPPPRPVPSRRHLFVTRVRVFVISNSRLPLK